MISKIKKMRA